MALIRYPGSKEKMLHAMLSRFPDDTDGACELWSFATRRAYREPFFGAGAVGFRVLRRLHVDCPVWINDADPGIVALWRSVRGEDTSAELCRRIDGFRPNAEDFYRFKAEDGQDGQDDLERAFRKLALHRMSYSGLGYMAGGPLGGKDQENAKYPVDCRWTPETMKRDIRRLSALMRAFPEFRITCGDFSAVIDGCPENAFLYVDPPYYEKGPELYKHSMTDEDHARLARSLKACAAPWVLSYDDHPFIRSLYEGCGIDEVTVTYTIAERSGGRRPKNKEVVIYPSHRTVAAESV